MSKSPTSGINQLVVKLRDDLTGLAAQARTASLTPTGRRQLNKRIAGAAADLNALLVSLDPVKHPRSVFDPGNPRTIGFFIALAMTAQPRQALAEISEFYGSGVYAIYYNGDYPLYAPLSKTETPIYVGQAAPGNHDARTPVEQGIRLAARLNEHRKNIIRASTLAIGDFDYRALAVQTGWETGAEDYLIRLFSPIWNKETKLVFGIGKHGDSATTRGNKRSPWDTLHEGRKWAGDTAENAKSVEKIAEQLVTHFGATRIYKTSDEVLTGFIEALRQS